MASSSVLKQNRKTKVNRKYTYEKRKKGVDNIVRKIGSDFDSVVNRINNEIYYCEIAYTNGIKGNSRNIGKSIDDLREKNDYSDSKINGSRSSLEAESQRCQREIDNLNAEIASFDSQIRSAEQREAEERRKAAEEALKSLLGGIIK